MTLRERHVPEISVILPTFNERDNIGPLIGEILKSLKGEAEVIVVDDDSPDGTWQIVEDLALAQRNLSLLRRIGRKGLVSAIREGIHVSRGGIVCWMDCDFSMPPEKMRELIDTVHQGADLAFGSRFVPDGGVEIVSGSKDTVLAYIMSRTLNCFVRKMLGTGYKDNTSGFIAVRREVLDRIPLEGDYGEYFIDLLHRAHRMGCKISELPYVSKARKAGVSKTGTHFFHYVKKGLKYVWLTLRLKFY